LELAELMITKNVSARGSVLVFLFVCALTVSPQLLAQEPVQSSPPATPQLASPAASQPQTKSTKDTGAEGSQPAPTPQRPKDDRIFWALPNLLTVEMASSLPPLTTGQKFKTVAQGCFDPVEVVFIGIQAGVGQADDANPTYGQGLIGYSKRFGTAYTDAIIGNFGTGAIFPTLLHKDPRYYQMGTGSFFRRFMHAAMRVAITRSDSGKTQFNFSEVLGNGLAAGASNAYHPGPHTLASSTDVWSTQIVLDAASYELKEFWPDIHRFLQRGKHKT
jgi:hypothetical protein